MYLYVNINTLLTLQQIKIKLKRLVKKRYVACFFFPLKFKIQDIISEKLFNDTENVYDFLKL
jgi:hypothetical protein